MKDVYDLQQNEMEKKIAEVSEDRQEERERLLTEQQELKLQFQTEIADVRHQKQRESELAAKVFDQRMREVEDRMKERENELIARQEEQLKLQAQQNRETIKNIMNQNAEDQKLALAEHQRQSEKAMKEQQAMYDRIDKERKSFAEQEMNQMKVL